MSDIVLSAATRSNLQSAQDTAQLLATTQTRLATGKKVNSALDSPVNFFTASGLDARASDINNVLDSISNGIQVLQAANTGITSIQKLIDSAKSVANQALQTAIGYSTKSNVATTITGATTSDLRGTTTYANAQASSNAIYDGTAGGTTAASSADKIGGVVGSLTGSAVNDNQSTPAAIVAATRLFATAGGGSSAAAGLSATATVADGDVITVNGKSITFKTGAVPAAASAPTGYGVTGNIATDGNGNSIVYLGASATDSTATVGDVMNAIDLASGVQSATITSGAAVLATNAGQTVSSITAGAVSLKSSTGADLAISGKADFLKALGLTTSTGSGNITLNAARTTSSATMGTLIADGSTLNVDGKTITFKNAAAPSASSTHTGIVTGNTNVETDGSGNSTVYLQGGTISDVLAAIDIATGTKTVTLASTGATATVVSGGTASTIASNGTLKISTGTTSDLSISGTGNALAALGLAGNTGSEPTFTASRSSTPGGLAGKTLTFAAFAGGTATTITFGDGTNGTVKTLDQLNSALSANNLVAALDATGKLTISSNNDNASKTIGSTADGGAVSGTAASLFSTAAAPVEDANSQTTRKSLISQYNTILQQINTTAQDASYNGVNLLGGDTLKLVFNETGKSTLSITGVTFDQSGLGLTTLGSNGANEFKDNASTNAVLTALTSASTLLRSQASAFGSNLSVVQTRQSFNKSLINVLQTGSANLTNADLNEEAANSQALNTRQSLAVSALSLANQSQQSVLQLLR